MQAYCVDTGRSTDVCDCKTDDRAAYQSGRKSALYFFNRGPLHYKTVFLPNQKIAKVNELVHVNIPEEYKGESIGEAVLKGIDLENEEVKCGHCYYFPGGAVRVSKVAAGQVKEVEVIRSRNVNIMPNL